MTTLACHSCFRDGAMGEDAGAPAGVDAAGAASAASAGANPVGGILQGAASVISAATPIITNLMGGSAAEKMAYKIEKKKLALQKELQALQAELARSDQAIKKNFAEIDRRRLEDSRHIEYGIQQSQAVLSKMQTARLMSLEASGISTGRDQTRYDLSVSAMNNLNQPLSAMQQQGQAEQSISEDSQVAASVAIGIGILAIAMIAIRRRKKVEGT